ncbi:MAG: HNH endonuclease [Caldilineaceae bacterium]|nr:HNH endonuclease [Caldilineaceae bacterium]
MSKQYISLAVRRRVAAFSQYRCGYCQTSQRIIGPFLEIDHIVPESKGGTADRLTLFLPVPIVTVKSRTTQLRLMWKPMKLSHSLIHAMTNGKSTLFGSRRAL